MLPNQVQSGPEPSEGEITIILGVTGSGKSHWLHENLRRPLPNRLVLWDTSGKYAQDQLIPGTRYRSLRHLFETLNKGNELGRAIVPARRAEFEALLRFAFSAGYMLLVLEELGAYTSAADHPKEALDDIALRGRERGLDVWAVTQRPQVCLPTNLYTQAKRLELFRIDHKADQRWCERELLLSPEEAGRLGTLQRGERLSKYRGFLQGPERKL